MVRAMKGKYWLTRNKFWRLVPGKSLGRPLVFLPKPARGGDRYGEIERGKIPVLPRSRYQSPEGGAKTLRLTAFRLDSMYSMCYIEFVVVSASLICTFSLPSVARKESKRLVSVPFAGR